MPGDGLLAVVVRLVCPDDGLVAVEVRGSEPGERVGRLVALDTRDFPKRVGIGDPRFHLCHERIGTQINLIP